jgi:trk system potassium uptake protein TrkA
MKVVIVGGGNVGFTSAEALCKVHDVLVIEKDSEMADNIKSLLSVSVLHEDGSNPKVLKSAIERLDADIIFSALPDDGLNLFVSMISKRMKHSIKTVACLRDPNYIVKTSDQGEPGIDMIISPELIMAEKMGMIGHLENVVQYDNLEKGNLALATFKVGKNSLVIGNIVMDIKIPAECTVVAIYRGENVILEVETAQIHINDRISVLGDPDAIVEFNKLLGVD